MFLVYILSLITGAIFTRRHPRVEHRGHEGARAARERVPPKRQREVGKRGPGTRGRPVAFVRSLGLEASIKGPRFRTKRVVLGSSQFGATSLTYTTIDKKV